MPQGILKYVIIIAIILLVVVLSQQPYFKQWGKTTGSEASKPVQGILTKGASWVNNNVASKITGEVQAKGDMINSAANNAKQNVSENILDKTKNYISGITNSILHPGTPQNCQPVQPATSTSASH